MYVFEWFVLLLCMFISLTEWWMVFVYFFGIKDGLKSRVADATSFHSLVLPEWSFLLIIFSADVFRGLAQFYVIKDFIDDGNSLMTTDSTQMNLLMCAFCTTMILSWLWSYFIFAPNNICVVSGLLTAMALFGIYTWFMVQAFFFASFVSKKGFIIVYYVYVCCVLVWNVLLKFFRPEKRTMVIGRQ